MTLYYQQYISLYLNTVYSLPSDPGTCHDQARRAYYNKGGQVCHQFVYSGCGGNGNNFQYESDCLRVCKGVWTKNLIDYTIMFDAWAQFFFFCRNIVTQ